MYVDGKSIRSRARDARELSAELQADAHALRGLAEALRDEGASRRESRRQRASARLVWETRMVDDGVVALPAMAPFLAFNSRAVGNEGVITVDEAKTLLSDHYGIDRGDAFAILRRTSSHTNRKLRDVARALVDAQ